MKKEQNSNNPEKQALNIPKPELLRVKTTSSTIILQEPVFRQTTSSCSTESLSFHWTAVTLSSWLICLC